MMTMRQFERLIASMLPRRGSVWRPIVLGAYIGLVLAVVIWAVSFS